jgi:hypothetical protein
VRVNAVVYYRVIDPEKAIIRSSTSRKRPASSRRPRFDPCSASTTSTRCCRARKLNADIRRILDEQTDAWGIKVSIVELKRRPRDHGAGNRPAGGSWHPAAKVIDAEGEFGRPRSSLRRDFRDQTEAMQLRYFTALQASPAVHFDHRVPIPTNLHQTLRGVDRS